MRVLPFAVLVTQLLFAACTASDAPPVAPDGGDAADGPRSDWTADGKPAADGDALLDAPSGDIGVLPQRRCATRFSFHPSGAAASVVLIGEWDGWAGETPMSDGDADGIYTVDKTLPAGIYGYRFKVQLASGGSPSFELDPANSYRRYHGGIENSAVRVDDCTRPLLEKISFTQAGGGSASARVRVLRGGSGGDDVESVEAHLLHDFVSRKLTGGEAALAGGELAVTLSGLSPGKYTLRLEARARDGKQAAPLLLPFWVEAEKFDWRDAMIYMVMIDRLKDGDPSNNAQPSSGATPSADFKGGDLAGLRQVIASGYLSKLGVRAIWISPLNENAVTVHIEQGHGVAAYHGYWPIKARAVDGRFGSEKDLEGVVKAAHAAGIRVLLDFVINHVHEAHEYFKSHPSWFRTGCQCGTSGCGWTERRLDCLFGAHMPDVNWEHPDGAETMIADALWWLERFDLDGLRVDAVKHVEDLAISNLATRVRERFEQAGTKYFLIGETAMGWNGHDVNNNKSEYDTISRYIGPNKLDGQFDFVLYHATAYRVFAYSDESMVHLDYWTRQSLLHYPKSAVMTPFIGSHDTSRFISQATYRGQDGAHPRNVPSNKWADWSGGLPAPPSDAEPYDRLKIALTWLYCQPGAPLLYYGDEYGEHGGADPDNRHMWRAESARDARQKALHAHVQALGKARRELLPLRRGAYVKVFADTDVLVFARVLAGESVLVALNRSGQAKSLSVAVPSTVPLPAGGTLRRVLASGQTVTASASKLTLQLPPWGAMILAR